MASNSAHQLAITTHRSSAMLAKVYGHPNVEALAMSLPSAATCLDVGAGASPLGVDVATLRPDIEWHNVDYSYFAPAILDEVSQNAPSNVRHIPGDATQPILPRNEYDAVFSYWLLQHLSAHDDMPARAVAANVYQSARSDASIQIGPATQGIRSIRTLMSDLPAASFSKAQAVDEQSFVDAVVTATRLEPLPRMIVDAADHVATPLFGTSRFIVKQDDKAHIVHMNTGEYVPVKSLAGALSVASLVLGITAEMAKQAVSNAFDR
ncbi:MAG: class I SAM-dependent methyltransferase [Candidatus Saccharibacteria bacterium]|nr:class I SAM-dependent methyltransferase [Candidatus Saccharibacteria bacterium]